ncbi:MAG: hypothetical protein HQK62_09555 [Desulfamplus sp.]|nr:hypothetical protein [Desulfamplus sp.]
MPICQFQEKLFFENSSINRNNGVITIENIWFFKPDYLVYSLSKDALAYWEDNKGSDGVAWKTDDYNLDGVADIEIFTSEGRQVIYEIKP